MSRTLRWSPGYRIIRTIFPPVDLFEDLSDPEDWELLATAEAKLNPRIRDVVGNLALVPVAKRVGGPTASIVMGAFTHVSVDRAGRFSDGRYGVWYCGDRVEVALAETAYHFEKFMSYAREPPAEADFRLLTCTVSGNVQDAPPDCLGDTDYTTGQVYGRTARRDGADGVQYQSVRFPAGQAAAMFWPTCATLPIILDQQFRYRWNGSRMTHYLRHGATGWDIWPMAGVA